MENENQKKKKKKKAEVATLAILIPQEMDFKTKAITRSNPASGYFLKKPKTLTQKGTYVYVLIAASRTIAKVWTKPRCPPTDDRIKRWGM